MQLSNTISGAVIPLAHKKCIESGAIISRGGSRRVQNIFRMEFHSVCDRTTKMHLPRNHANNERPSLLVTNDN